MDPDYIGSVPDFLSDPDLDSGNKSDPDPDKKTRIRNTGFTFYIPVLGSSVAEPHPVDGSVSGSPYYGGGAPGTATNIKHFSLFYYCTCTVPVQYIYLPVPAQEGSRYGKIYTIKIC